MHASEAIRCVYCNAAIDADDDAQRVGKREVAHTRCAFAVDEAFFFFTFDAENEQSDADTDKQ